MRFDDAGAPQPSGRRVFVALKAAEAAVVPDVAGLKFACVPMTLPLLRKIEIIAVKKLTRIIAKMHVAFITSRTPHKNYPRTRTHRHTHAHTKQSYTLHAKSIYACLHPFAAKMGFIGLV